MIVCCRLWRVRAALAFRAHESRPCALFDRAGGLLVFRVWRIEEGG